MGCSAISPATLPLQVPLDTLSAELEAHLATLKQRLVEVINEDYADFVSLSGKLVNVDGAVLRMHRPLLEIQARAFPLLPEVVLVTAIRVCVSPRVRGCACFSPCKP